jgi:hypothetical protein
MYAAIVKKGIASASTSSSNNGGHTTNDECDVKFTNTRAKRYSEPKYIWRRDRSYDSWERTYFRELLELREILITDMSEIDDTMEIYLRSHQFLYKFNQFIYKNSSTIVSKFLEQMTTELESIYSEYKDMRHKINEWDE